MKKTFRHVPCLLRVICVLTLMLRRTQVSARLYGILNIFAERSRSFSRACVALCVPHLSEKLGDMKLKKPAGETLLLFAEKTSLQFVFGQGSCCLHAPCER